MAQGAHMRDASTSASRRPSDKAAVGRPATWHRGVVAVMFTAAGLFALLLTLIITADKAPLAIDEAALTLALSLRTDLVTEIMWQVTYLVMPAVLAVALVALSALGHGPGPAAATLVGAGTAVALNAALKHLIGRPRPPAELRLALETSTSFPSSHAVTAMAFYGLLIWFVWHYQRAGAWRNFLVGLLVLAIVLVGVSRIYLAVHYLSDILGGYCLALVWLMVYTRLVTPRILAMDD